MSRSTKCQGIALKFKPVSAMLKRLGPRSFEVVGLPTGNYAKISNSAGLWQVWHSHASKPGAWLGSYDSPEAAMRELLHAIAPEEGPVSGDRYDVGLSSGT